LESIIGFGDVDLSFTLDEETAQSDDSIDRPLQPAGSELLNQAGFQYDVFLQQFRSGKIGMLKSLMKISQRTGALYAAILARKNENWIIFDSVGFDKEHSSNIVLRQNDVLYKRFLQGREPVMFDLDEAKEYLGEIVSERDREYINSVLFVPAVFQGSDVYLYLGLKSAHPDVESILNSLSQM